jgi:hypothetical protein
MSDRFVVGAFGDTLHPLNKVFNFKFSLDKHSALSIKACDSFVNDIFFFTSYENSKF